MNYKTVHIKKLFIIPLFILISVINTFAQETGDVPIYVTPEQRYARELEILYDEIALSFGFLRDNSGVKGKAMGDAFVAIADDGAAINANNAGIGQIRQPQLLSYIDLDVDGTSFLGYVHPIRDLSSFGSSVIYTRNPEYGEKITVVTTAYSWALQTEGNAYLGIGAKGFSRQSDAFDTNGVAADIGLWIKFWNSNLSLGIVAQNIGPEMKLKVNDLGALLKRANLESSLLPYYLALPNKVPLPYSVKFGMAYRAQPGNLPVLLTGELDIPSIGFIKLSLGGEISLPGILALRFGYSSQSDIGNRYTMGLGFKFSWMHLGYSYVISGDEKNKHQVYFSSNF